MRRRGHERRSIVRHPSKAKSGANLPFEKNEMKKCTREG